MRLSKKPGRRLGRLVVGMIACTVLAAGAPIAWSAQDAPEAVEPPKAPSAEKAPADADKGEAKSAPAKALPAQGKTEGKPDPFAVPDGTPEELVKYLERIGRMEPPARDEKTVSEFSRKVAGAALKAADKILAAKPKNEQAAFAVNVKVEVLGMLDGLGDKEAFSKLEALPAELQKAGWPKLARFVRGVALQARLMRVGPTDAAEFKKALEEIKKHMSQGPLQDSDADLAINAAMAAENVDRTGLAAAAYEDFGKVFSASEDKRLARLGAKFQGAARRLALVGKPMELEGATVDGKPLVWAKHRGSVVLVLFWATWCRPCRAEIAGIKRYYDAYHTKGFDVVAISVDEEKDQLESFLAENRFPWTVLYDRALERVDKDQTMGTKYGVIPIPELILVGKDGNVVSENVRGRALGRELEKLLGPPAEAVKEPGREIDKSEDAKAGSLDKR